MAKTFTIDLPITQTRELKYTRQERLDFERRFKDLGPGMKDIIEKYVLIPIPDPQKPGRWTVNAGGNLAAQEYIVYLGLRHLGKFITEDRVAEWLDIAAREEEGRPLVLFVAQACAAVYASGILGFRIEGKVETEEEVAPATEGKAEATA